MFLRGRRRSFASLRLATMEAPVTTPPPQDGIQELPNVSKAAPVNALTPPTSEDNHSNNMDDGSSDLSEIEDDVDDEIVPDHYYDGGKVPVFKPVRLYPTRASIQSYARRNAKTFMDLTDGSGRQWISSATLRNSSSALTSTACNPASSRLSLPKNGMFVNFV